MDRLYGTDEHPACRCSSSRMYIPVGLPTPQLLRSTYQLRITETIYKIDFIMQLLVTIKQYIVQVRLCRMYKNKLSAWCNHLKVTKINQLSTIVNIGLVYFCWLEIIKYTWIFIK